jgi:hypothetical protein
VLGVLHRRQAALPVARVDCFDQVTPVERSDHLPRCATGHQPRDRRSNPLWGPWSVGSLLHRSRSLTDTSGQTGLYYDENGKPMAGSTQVRDPVFADRIITETREPPATIPMDTRV